MAKEKSQVYYCKVIKVKRGRAIFEGFDDRGIPLVSKLPRNVTAHHNLGERDEFKYSPPASGPITLENISNIITYEEITQQILAEVEAWDTGQLARISKELDL